MSNKDQKQTYKNVVIDIAKKFIEKEYDGSIIWAHIGKGEKDKIVGATHTTIQYLLQKLRLNPGSMNDLYIAESLKIQDVINLTTDPYQMLLGAADDAIKMIENEDDWVDEGQIHAAKSQIDYIIKSAAHLEGANDFVSDESREKMLNAKINFIEDCLQEFKRHIKNLRA